MGQNEKQCCDSLNVNSKKNNKNFWRTLTPNFSNKIVCNISVVLMVEKWR